MRNKIGKDTLARGRVLKGQVEHTLIFEKVYKHGGNETKKAFHSVWKKYFCLLQKKKKTQQTRFEQRPYLKQQGKNRSECAKHYD